MVRAEQAAPQFCDNNSAITILNTMRLKVGNLVAEVLYRIVRYAESSQSTDEAAIRQILQSYPYWARGHLLLGERQLERKEKIGAYSCALAAAELLGQDRTEVQLLLAKVYLQSGRENAAVEILAGLSEKHPHHQGISEELGAGYIFQGKHQQAQAVLEHIPLQHRSSSVLAMLAYLKTQNSNQRKTE